jgi:hypothetical protein
VFPKLSTTPNDSVSLPTKPALGAYRTVVAPALIEAVPKLGSKVMLVIVRFEPMSCSSTSSTVVPSTQTGSVVGQSTRSGVVKTIESRKLPIVGPPVALTAANSKRVSVCPAGTTYTPACVLHASLPSTISRCTTAAPGGPMARRMASAPLRPRCASDQKSCAPGTVAMSWYSVLSCAAFSSAK